MSTEGPLEEVMSKASWKAQLDACEEYFNRSTRCLAEEDSGFRATEGTYTVAQQVAHVAQTIDWFIEGAFDPKGLDPDFAAHDKKVRAVKSLEAARAWFRKAVDGARAAVATRSDADWNKPIAKESIMGGLPRSSVIGGIVEHTAHHRGSLAVYTRLLGKVPPMPYMDL